MVIAEAIVEKLLEDLNNRSGFDIGGLDDDIQEEIKEAWKNIIETELRKV